MNSKKESLIDCGTFPRTAKWMAQIRSYHVAALLQRELQHRPDGAITQSDALDLFSSDHHQRDVIWGSGLLKKAGLLTKSKGVWKLTTKGLGRRRLITEAEAFEIAQKAKWERSAGNRA